MNHAAVMVSDPLPLKENLGMTIKAVGGHSESHRPLVFVGSKYDRRNSIATPIFATLFANSTIGSQILGVHGGFVITHPIS